MLPRPPRTTPGAVMQFHTDASSRIGESRKVWLYNHREMDKSGPLLVPAPQLSASSASHTFWMPQPPYMLVPTHQPSTNANYSFRNIPYNPSLLSTAAPTATASRTAPPQYKPPAHKHAHHLHSIPPREKSTRTLIIDHMLWVHGRTRFAQARAELGMTDRTGGPSSSNHTHRHRPENYEEEDEVGSENEDVSNLKARSDVPSQFNDAENERISTQDLPLAQSLRLRAEGLEKVVTSMLDQPPPIHPVVNDDITSPPTTSPRPKPASIRHPHKLPNGVRLRLALGTIINDLFARQAPRPPYRYTHPPGSTMPATTDSTSQLSSESSSSALPASLIPLSSVSGAKTLFSYNTAQKPVIPQFYPQVSTLSSLHSLLLIDENPTAESAPKCKPACYLPLSHRGKFNNGQLYYRSSLPPPSSHPM
ncbi:hypothetical protein AX15_001899 [Amanita polypyramis BW_CC]|nr:hypothetical protein AX15_001899 [Amanita polypyramis BW_CC]